MKTWHTLLWLAFAPAAAVLGEQQPPADQQLAAGSRGHFAVHSRASRAASHDQNPPV